ncbi:unnamed protein product, partial [Ectocarpus sp. 12 AP-2014]
MPATFFCVPSSEKLYPRTTFRLRFSAKRREPCRRATTPLVAARRGRHHHQATRRTWRSCCGAAGKGRFRRRRVEGSWEAAPAPGRRAPPFAASGVSEAEWGR